MSQYRVSETCCSRQSIANLDHKKWTHNSIDPNETEWVVNRVCIHCYRHWYGPENNVKVYSKSEWDKWMDEALK